MDNPTRQKLEGRTRQSAGGQGYLRGGMAFPDVSQRAAAHSLQALEHGLRCGIPWDEIKQHFFGNH